MGPGSRREGRDFEIGDPTREIRAAPSAGGFAAFRPGKLLSPSILVLTAAATLFWVALTADSEVRSRP
jgi:hypothetical protein